MGKLLPPVSEIVQLEEGTERDRGKSWNKEESWIDRVIYIK